ncbi:PA2169 family four-helix-bundle protein [Hymenobacter sp. BT683]|uniref:PA2169 family four-helix-bundle protein n=1 Tax=Hymenobacter jeongseonensis TaxID=2791027 RepID=A0ABS0ICT7_9BACT|nr:PA2169 family four-helix-bundle protein [Hymenobacter jeongseonensis]MBF9236162.1 PA2169 family four-helix-bundle protein [Hymenobacter jeongseonensis]
MADTSKLADTLNELTLFVNDRIEGYKTAAAETKDPQNQAYYQELVQQSEQFVSELNGFARAAGGNAESSTTLKGKFYRGFMDAKAIVTNRSESSILDSNIYGEEWALKAYAEALAAADLTGAARQAVERQHQAAQQTLRKLQQLKAVASVG